MVEQRWGGHDAGTQRPSCMHAAELKKQNIEGEVRLH